MDSVNIYSYLESKPLSLPIEWDKPTLAAKLKTAEDFFAIINNVNKSINLVEFFQSQYGNVEEVHGANGWDYKMKCPFHKNGEERTPSFYINKVDNRYYCQGCGKNGGIVEFIASKHKRPLVLVVEHVLNCLSGNYNAEAAINSQRIKEHKQYQECILNISQIYNSFIKKYYNNEDAVKYINTCYYAFDCMCQTNPDAVKKNIQELYKRFVKYVEKYEKEKE